MWLCVCEMWQGKYKMEFTDSVRIGFRQEMKDVYVRAAFWQNDIFNPCLVLFCISFLCCSSHLFLCVASLIQLPAQVFLIRTVLSWLDECYWSCCAWVCRDHESADVTFSHVTTLQNLIEWPDNLLWLVLMGKTAKTMIYDLLYPLCLNFTPSLHGCSSAPSTHHTGGIICLLNNTL